MVNDALRNPEKLAAQERAGEREMWQKTQNGLDELFKGVPPTTRPWTLYRGASGPFVMDIVNQYESMIEKGREEFQTTGKPPASFVLPSFTDQGFVSTTPDKDVAMHFTGSGFQGGPMYTGDGRALFEINLPEGSKMVNVEEYFNEFGGFARFAAEESEFLLPRGMTFEVTDVTPSEEQFADRGPMFYTIKLDVVPTATKSLKHADHDQSDHGSWATGDVNNQSRNVVELGKPYPTRAPHTSTGYAEPQSSVALPNGRSVDIQSGGDAVSGGYNGYFVMHDKETGERMGYLDYQSSGSGDDKRVQIAMVETTEGYRGQGVATALLARLVAEFPETKIEPGLTTEDGGRWWQSVKPLLPASSKAYKHADHDQSDHGSWATGESAETKFNEDENGAITIYTDQGHMSINGYLRGSRYGGDDQYVPKWVANLDSAIESAGPTTRNMTIYRGVSQRHLQELIDGGVLQDAGFASFTKDGETAAGFATGGSVGIRRSDGAVLELDLPAGSAALDMKDAGIPNEQEVLLPRGSRFELISGPEELDLSNEEDNESNRLPVYQIRLVSPTKSLKHGDHDQEDHGNWARGFDVPSSSVPTPAGSKTTVPLWWHERDQTVSLDNMRNGMEASVREALDAYTHWSADDGYETGTRLAFHAALNERLRAGDSRFKAVEAVARLFAEADDEELVAKLGRGFMDIDNALRDSKVKEDMMVTRASSPIMSIQELEAAAKGESINIYGQEIAPGAVYSDAGIISTSADMTYQSTQFFAQNWDSPEGLEDWQVPTTVRWNINLPSGAPALDLRALGFASQHGEDEVLLPRNTHFRIDGVDVQLPTMDGGSAKVTVSATVIPTHSTAKP
jgi:GNAT superfamily N-acetyltransferase